MLERLAIDRAVDREGAVLAQYVLPMVLLNLLIEVIGIGRLKFLEGFQHSQGSAQAEVGPIHQFLVALEGNHASSLLHILCSQSHQLITQNPFQPLEGLSNHFKSLTHNHVKNV